MADKCSMSVPVNSTIAGRGSLSVTYDVFMRDYWPHFAQSLTTKLGKSYACIVRQLNANFQWQILH